MMARYLQRQAQQRFEQWRKQYEKLKTPEQIAAYQKRLREQFLEAIGGLPERTPLKPQVTGTVQRDGYRVEKIIFESQPKHYVTALLFLPDAERFKPPYPGVIVPCGHAAKARATRRTRRWAASAGPQRHGGPGLRPDRPGRARPDASATAADASGARPRHTMVGVGSILLGRNTARFEIWDGMRAIDYLQSRPEVDPERIGCTGNSGGGTQTTYLMALDDRIRAAAPSCYLTGFDAAALDTIGPQDAEQNIFGQLAFGMDHADYLMMRAPSPILICAATQDFFDIEGTWDTLPLRQAALHPPGLRRADRPAGKRRRAQLQRRPAGRRRALDVAVAPGQGQPITEPKLELLTDEEFRARPTAR